MLEENTSEKDLEGTVIVFQKVFFIKKIRVFFKNGATTNFLCMCCIDIVDLYICMCEVYINLFGLDVETLLRVV